MRDLGLSMFIVIGLVAAQPAIGQLEDFFDDIDPATAPVTAYMQTADIFYIDSTTKKLEKTTADYITAKTDLIVNHFTTDEGTDLDHLHWKGTLGNRTDEVSEYWKAIFSRCTPVQGSSASFGHNCHSYAFNQVGDGGTYGYDCVAWNADFQQLYDDETNEVQGALQANDLLSYGHKHTTIVTATNGTEPTSLKWKWGWSQIFTYTPPDGHEFDTPYCLGVNSVGKTLQEQPNMRWDPDYADDGTAYRDD